LHAAEVIDPVRAAWTGARSDCVLKTQRESSGSYLAERLSACRPESVRGPGRQAFAADYFL
jgi:hypothetical protein